MSSVFSKYFQPEMIEDIPSVKKSLQQATCQASKLLLPSMHDYKRLEVSDGEDGESTPLTVFIIMNLCVSLKQKLLKLCYIYLVEDRFPLDISHFTDLCACLMIFAAFPFVSISFPNLSPDIVSFYLAVARVQNDIFCSPKVSEPQVF